MPICHLQNAACRASHSGNIKRIFKIDRNIKREKKVKKRYLRITCALLAVTMLCAAMLGCSSDGSDSGGGDGASQGDLMLGITPGVIAERLPDAEYYAALRKVISAVATGALSSKDNSALSPIASLFSISLAANTMSDKKQNELLLALGDIKMTALNEYNSTYAHILGKEADVSLYSVMKINSGKTAFIPDSSFLQLNADHYGAGIYRSDFSGEDINAVIADTVAVKLGITGIAPDAKCTSETASLIFDLLGFTGGFETGFYGKETAVFNAPSGEKEVSYLVSNESLYASAAGASGFAKRFENGCTLVALMPTGSTTLEQVIRSLDADTLTSCYNGINEGAERTVKIPEFSFDHCADVTSVFRSLGMKSAFSLDAASDGEKTELPIEKLINVTSVHLTENGFTTSSLTPSAANAGVTAEETAVQTVFDRPFVFIIFDPSGIPLTVGTVVTA